MENVLESSQLHSFQTSDEYKPSLLLRVKASIIDFVVLILLSFSLVFIMDLISIESNIIRGVLILLIFLYEPIFTSLSATIGQRIMGLQVKNFRALSKTNELKPINLFFAIVRYLVKILLGWISLLTIHTNPFGLAIHDRISNSIMTQV